MKRGWQGAAIDFLGSDAADFPQLWSATAFAKEGNAIFFRPRSDGVVDMTYHNFDDWAPLAWGLCRYTVNPDGSRAIRSNAAIDPGNSEEITSGAPR